jgi:hypothetical protein
MVKQALRSGAAVTDHTAHIDDETLDVLDSFVS